MKRKVICIVGPTASGKTGLGIKLAKKINGEIISADSMQIYKGLNVGTAKVTEEEAENIPHHIIDVCEITENFSVADFKDMCYDKINDIFSRGKNVIIVGGTGLYISAVVNDMQFTEEKIDYKLREELENIASTEGKDKLYEILKKLDKKSAENIHPNNIKRVIRAIEIAKNSNITKSEHMENEKNRIENGDIPYDFKIFYIDWDRENLYDRINKRVDIMMESGLLEEAKYVYDLKLPINNTCRQAIGYKEFFDYFDGKCTLEEAIEKLKQESRKYAKRQETWFKNKLEINYLNGLEDKNKLINNIIKITNF